MKALDDAIEALASLFDDDEDLQAHFDRQTAERAKRVTPISEGAGRGACLTDAVDSIVASGSLPKQKQQLLTRWFA